LQCTETVKYIVYQSNTKHCVWPQFQTPRRELKIWCAAAYFWSTSRCLEMWTNTVLSIWYIFSIKNKTKENTQKQNCKNLCYLRSDIQTLSRPWVLLFKLDELWMSLRKKIRNTSSFEQTGGVDIIMNSD